MKLGEVEPALVARSQHPVTMLMRDLVAEAADAGAIRTEGVDGATYMILAVKSAFITSQTLGNDTGVGLPEVYALTSFCLAGLGAAVDDAWLDKVSAKLRLPSASASPPAPAPSGPDPRFGVRHVRIAT